MKWIKGEEGSPSYLVIGQLQVLGCNEWGQLLNSKRFNWLSATIVSIYFEHDTMFNQIEIMLALLGFTVCFRYDLDYKHSRGKQMADRAYAEIRSEDSWKALCQEALAALKDEPGPSPEAVAALQTRYHRMRENENTDD